MSTAQTVTTRRVIKPGQSSPQSQAASPDAAQRMWTTWLARFEQTNRAATAGGAAQERAMWAGLPARPDPELARQVQARFLQPWQTMLETFDLASTTANLPAAVRQDYAAYLRLRVDYYRAVMRRCLTCSPATTEALTAQERLIDAFMAARRKPA